MLQIIQNVCVVTKRTNLQFTSEEKDFVCET